ncbi:MAG TPA: hypothetical protein VFD36_26355 [Kofleriaceae bacterium]|jgi:hypothetical protein|nr:hypothetical protein [Kofleriaceae bacterium]
MTDWAGFLALATRMAAEDGEAELRSAVSRAYYSAYNDARRYVRNKAPMFSFKDDQHWLVWDWFAAAPGQAPQVATLGTALRKTRNRADYNVYTPMQNLKYEAMTAVQKATKILSLLDSLRS